MYKGGARTKSSCVFLGKISFLDELARLLSLRERERERDREIERERERERGRDRKRDRDR
jgi:hypothetical protein